VYESVGRFNLPVDVGYPHGEEYTKTTVPSGADSGKRRNNDEKDKKQANRARANKITETETRQREHGREGRMVASRSVG